MWMFIRRSEKDQSSDYYCTQYICDLCRKTGRKTPEEYNVVFYVSKSFLPITRVLGPLHEKASSTCISLAYCCITQKLRNYSNFRKISINLPCAPLLLLRLRSLPLPCPLPLLPARKKGKKYITFKTFSSFGFYTSSSLTLHCMMLASLPPAETSLWWEITNVKQFPDQLQKSKKLSNRFWLFLAKVLVTELIFCTVSYHMIIYTCDFFRHLCTSLRFRNQIVTQITTTRTVPWSGLRRRQETISYIRPCAPSEEGDVRDVRRVPVELHRAGPGLRGRVGVGADATEVVPGRHQGVGGVAGVHVGAVGGPEIDCT